MIWLVLTAIWVGLGYLIGKAKGRVALGCGLGAVIGVFGVIIIACLPKTEAKKLEEEVAARRRADLAARIAAGQARDPGAPPYTDPGVNPWSGMPKV